MTTTKTHILLRLLEERGLSQNGLAGAINRSRSRIGQLIRDTKYPDSKTVTKIARWLNVERSALVDKDGRWLP